jgi:hypothetical protein
MALFSSWRDLVLETDLPSRGRKVSTPQKRSARTERQRRGRRLLSFPRQEKASRALTTTQGSVSLIRKRYLIRDGKAVLTPFLVLGGVLLPAREEIRYLDTPSVILEEKQARCLAGQITHAHGNPNRPLKTVVPDENNRAFTLEEAVTSMCFPV